jgi:thiol peroxidase
MAEITLKGNKIHTVGQLPEVGQNAPDFKLTTVTLEDVNLASFKGKKLVLNIFPSVDTPVCAMSVRQFHKTAAEKENVAVLCISMDLPFAHQRFCGAEGIKNVSSLSAFRSETFGKDYGVTITDGPLAGVLSRAVVVVDESGKIIYTEQVPEIAQEPNYDAVLKCL